MRLTEYHRQLVLLVDVLGTGKQKPMENCLEIASGLNELLSIDFYSKLLKCLEDQRC